MSVYILGNFDEHTMTPRQDGGFFVGLKMSQLSTSQDLWTQDFLRAARSLSQNAQAGCVVEPGFSHGRPPETDKKLELARIFNGRGGKE